MQSDDTPNHVKPLKRLSPEEQKQEPSQAKRVGPMKSTHFTTVTCSDGGVSILTKIKYLSIFPMPHTAVMPLSSSAFVRRPGIMIRYKTSDAGILERCHNAVADAVRRFGFDLLWHLTQIGSFPWPEQSNGLRQYVEDLGEPFFEAMPSGVAFGQEMAGRAVLFALSFLVYRVRWWAPLVVAPVFWQIWGFLLGRASAIHHLRLERLANLVTFIAWGGYVVYSTVSFGFHMRHWYGWAAGLGVGIFVANILGFLSPSRVLPANATTVKYWLAKLAGVRAYGDVIGGANVQYGLGLGRMLYMGHGTRTTASDVFVFDDEYQMEAEGFRLYCAGSVRLRKRGEGFTLDWADAVRRPAPEDSSELSRQTRAAGIAFAVCCSQIAATYFMKPKNADTFIRSMGDSIRREINRLGLDIKFDAILQFLKLPRPPDFTAIVQEEKPGTNDVLCVYLQEINRQNRTVGFRRSGEYGFGPFALALARATINKIRLGAKDYRW